MPTANSLQRLGLYLHVPFCRKICPFCPYHRVEIDAGLYSRFERAVLREIDLYAEPLGDSDIVSLYVGGGTPTVDVDGLCRILGHLKTRFKVDRNVCVEIHPSDGTHDCFERLLAAGVTMVSIGVQSLATPMLTALGRSHDAATGIEAIRCAMRHEFDTVNADLMFALPGQTVQQWRDELSQVLAEGIDQLSTYPLFGLPYSEIGQQLKLEHPRRPPSRMMRTMLDVADEEARRAGMKRCAVWSWIRPSRVKFSSVSRHHYIGFGPSAASMTGSDFYVNTFHIEEYARQLPDHRPVALTMPMGPRREMAYWLYWRLYELHAEDADFAEVFGPERSLPEVFGLALKPLELMGWIDRRDGGYDVAHDGIYWIHRLQNEYSLDYITKLWGECSKTAWPEAVAL
jgi:menaquinone C8-methyltransferase